MEDFVTTLTGLKKYDLDLDCDFVRGFFGVSKEETLNYLEFTQLLKSMETEALRQAYFKFAKIHVQNQEGSFITPAEFAHIFKRVLSQRNQNSLPSNLIQNLETICQTDRITYSHFIAFYNVIRYGEFFLDLQFTLFRSFDRVHRAVVDAASQKQQPTVTRKEFLRIARRLDLVEFTPLEAELVFRIFDSDGDGLISAQDISENVKIGTKPRLDEHRVAGAAQVAKDV